MPPLRWLLPGLLLLLLPLAGAPARAIAPAAHDPATTRDTRDRQPKPWTGGLREPDWAPHGRRVAVSAVDRIWTMTPDGRDPRPLTAGAPHGAERDPAWSPDGRSIAFAADRGEGFDLHVISARGGASRRLTALGGDARWPSWTRDGRLVFAHRDSPAAPWALHITEPVEPPGAGPVRHTALTRAPDEALQPRVSPDGRRVAFVSDRESEDGDLDVWTLELPGQTAGAGEATVRGFRRITQTRGAEASPSWAPGGDRLAYYAVRDGVGTVWVSPVEPLERGDALPVRPVAPPVLVSRRGGTPAWSPDGRTILIAELPPPEPGYNGNPDLGAAEPPPLFSLTTAFNLWSVAAPTRVDAGLRGITPALGVDAARNTAVFDRVWRLLKDLYYRHGPSAAAWEALGARHRPAAAQARDEAALEAVIDRLVLEQPLIKPAVWSSHAVVVSGHALASEAGARVLERGGNVVDAAIAVSFVLGVVEPEASGIGGDGMAVLYLEGMEAPTVIDYKDQTPIHATLDNPRIFRDGRLAADGPAAANIPGVVAGMDYLFREYGSGSVAWAALIEPAIGYAEEGFVLDAALPTSLAQGRRLLEKHPEAGRIYLPGGRVPRPGDRFVNPDYGATLRAIAQGGAREFYKGGIARRIAEDLAANGGIIGYEDLAQYRAIERAPVAGRYRGHVVYSAPPPVSSGVALIETLQILDHYAPQSGVRYTRDADYLHYLIEAWKMRAPITRIADPDRWPVDFGLHLSVGHAAERFRRIDPRQASQFPEAGGRPVEAPARIGRGTTAFAVADRRGNMIAATQTLSTWGGNFYVSGGLGFLYNNHLRTSRTTRGEYGQLLPLVRSSTASVPTLVFAPAGGDGASERLVPRLAVGAAGNAWIASSVYNILTNVIDSKMPMQEAVEAPRFLVSRDPLDPALARTQIEDRIPRAVLDELTRRGHRFQRIGRKGEVRYGYASAVLIDVAGGRVEGGADPRRSHAAAAPGGVDLVVEGAAGRQVGAGGGGAWQR